MKDCGNDVYYTYVEDSRVMHQYATGEDPLDDIDYGDSDDDSDAEASDVDERDKRDAKDGDFNESKAAGESKRTVRMDQSPKLEIST
ncbi:hypothetical protein M436DRAFT_79654 [Aureobasidium namibiae CBS 147.97]|uniref:Uncharacterized protein n=1 Tax=Aureobasidium namibiae CBS 147.97 TaxID=1043004 RepID=A0A074WZL8_9PEZI|nr:uncharacterized protein M436DRAFT_79654 [Aureobasidium namibiae CBS 147.97]KEQ75237.1 hypothetical protein M436DRAFT_79654 [Aureobasidium namibiae CBS 147.97]